MDLLRWWHAHSPCEPLTSVEQRIRLGHIIAVGQNEGDTLFAINDGEPIQVRVIVSHGSPGGTSMSSPAGALAPPRAARSGGAWADFARLRPRR